jgi:maleamate amidohydrolase
MNEQLLGTRPVFGRRPALVVIDMTLGFTDPESPLACDLEGPITEIQKLLRATRRAAPVLKGVEGLI